MNLITIRLSALDSGDWIALVAVVVSVVVAAITTYLGRISARTGQEAAEAARRSAEEAATISRIERERRDEEREVRHEYLAPHTPNEIVGELQEGLTGTSLFGWIAIPDRDYRVSAEAILGANVKAPIDLPLLMPANQALRIHIEHWPEGRTRPQTREIVFKFWPPVADIDGKAPWSCACGRATGESADNDAHWERRVRVTYHNPLGGNH